MMFSPRHAWSLKTGMNHDEFEQLLRETELFSEAIRDPEYNILGNPASSTVIGFSIEDTGFWLMTDINLISPYFWWAEEIRVDTRYFGALGVLDTQSCTFEEMFEGLPEHIRERFIFHLDLFIL